MEFRFLLDSPLFPAHVLAFQLLDFGFSLQQDGDYVCMQIEAPTVDQAFALGAQVAFNMSFLSKQPMYIKD